MTKPLTNRLERSLTSAQKTGGIPPMLIAQIKSEFLHHLRVPEFLVGIVAIPVMLFVMFGLPSAAIQLPGGIRVGAMMMASFSAYGLLSLAIFSFGSGIAEERGGGWLKLMRTTPMPAWAYVAGKLAMSLLFGTTILLVMFGVAYLFAGVRMPLYKWVSVFSTLIAGGLSFSTLGFALAYWARPRAASTIANLVYLPLSFASGFFFPLNQLPQFLKDLAPYLPTYHFGQLVWGSVGTPEAVRRFTGIAPQGYAEHLLWLAGCFVLFGVVALIGYRRDRGEQAR